MNLFLVVPEIVIFLILKNIILLKWMYRLDEKISFKFCEFNIGAMETCTDLFKQRHQMYSVSK